MGKMDLRVTDFILNSHLHSNFERCQPKEKNGVDPQFYNVPSWPLCSADSVSNISKFSPENAKNQQENVNILLKHNVVLLY